MCAASPARKSRPCCMGSTTKLRIGVMPFLQDLARVQRPTLEFEPPGQLVPDALVGPLIESSSVLHWR